MAKRIILVDEKDYQNVVNMCDKASIKNQNGDIQWHWHWITAITAWAIGGGVLALIAWMN
jgi:hypothetical protein